jgi:hypothetical protein
MDPGAARDMALAVPGTVEADHFGNPSYRANGAPDAQGKVKKGVIFMTLQIEQHTATLMLTVEQQADVCAHHPEVFAPLPNKWGEKGATRVALAAATPHVLKPALELAWRNALR